MHLSRDRVDDVDWQSTARLEPRTYCCGHCGRKVGPNTGYHAPSRPGLLIYLCSSCQRPTFFEDDQQIPGALVGEDVQSLPPLICEVYDEARRCMSVRAYTAAVLACRKLLMNVAVANRAEENKSFEYYVNFLADTGWIAPNARPWVDRIRKLGNEATHEIEHRSKEDATDALAFVEMLLRTVYEFPARLDGDGGGGEAPRRRE